MTKKSGSTRRIRLSIDLTPEEYRQLRVVSALYGENIREYVIKSIRESIDHGVKKKELNYILENVVKDPVIKQLWAKNEEKKDDYKD